MLGTRGLGILARRDPITDDDVFALIAARRELVNPYIDAMPLIKLGDLECLEYETNHPHAPRKDNPEVIGYNRFSLETEGIFFRQPSLAVEKFSDTGYTSPKGASFPNGVMCIWGLTRFGQWLLVTINFAGEAGHNERGYMRAVKVEIAERDLRTIATATKEKPKDMWNKLGSAIKKWAAQLRSAYEEADSLSRRVEEEEKVFSLIPERVPERAK